MTQKKVSPLREREDMRIRDMGDKSQKAHIWDKAAVARFNLNVRNQYLQTF